LLPHGAILRRIDQIVRELGIDLVQANASDNLKYAVLSQQLYGWSAPVVFRNASILSAWLRTPLHRLFSQYLLRRTAAIACVSRQSRQDLIDNVGIAPGLLHYLPIGTSVPGQIDVAAARGSLRAVAPVPKKAWVLLHVGAFSPEKNQAALIQLMETLPATVANRPLHLVLIGDGPLREAISQRAALLSERIHFLGRRTDVPELMPAADLFLLPSKIEGTPGVVLEAGAAGVPTVGYDVGSIHECLPIDRQQYLVPRDDLAALQRRVVNLLENAPEREELGRQVRKFVEEHYQMERIAERFAVLYRSILQ
jgi:glycosyltransferase involved in cell wall biosynthesis